MSEFTLHLSNERIEQGLSENEPSSASDFDAIINPSLDLSFLTFLRANDVELNLENFKISSAALTFKRDEHIQVLLNIPTELAEANWIYASEAVKNHNLLPMKIRTHDFTTSDPKDALDYINDLFCGKINLFLMCRYLSILCDEEKLFKSDIFENKENEEEQMTSHELKLMRRYADCGLFSRIEIAKSMLKVLYPEQQLSDYSNDRMHSLSVDVV